MDKLLAQLVEKLQKAFGDRLVSVVLYGSAAAGDHQARFSDYNILCVLSEITPRELGAGEDIFRWWHEQSSPAPLLLTEHEIATSTDCFAIEFLDIQRRHRLLFGKDVITSLKVDDSFYRAQVEHDLRAKLLRLRQKAGGILSNPDLLRRLLLDSVSTFCVLFRHAILLTEADAARSTPLQPDRSLAREARGTVAALIGNAAPPGNAAPLGDPPAEVGNNKRDVIQRAHQVFAIDPAPFEKLLDVREGRRKPRDFEPVDTLSACLKGISQVIDAVDQLAK